MKLHAKTKKLTEFIDHLPAKGRYTFLRSEAFDALGISNDALKLALNRQIKKKRIVKPANGFYVIVPLEYLTSGAPPASWFIDDLMKFLEQPYYVALLNAAALHGAAHQQPQEFQVITNKPLRPILCGRNRIRFITKRNMEKSSTELIKTSTGYMKVSTPETTAFDLIRYIEPAGHLNNIATVLSELSEKIHSERLVKVVDDENIEAAYLQRIGFLLDITGSGHKTKLLHKKLNKFSTVRSIPLSTINPFNANQKNEKWRLYINENIEAD